MKRALHLLLLLLLLLALPLPAVRYPFINYRSSEGLPQNNITALLQDGEGFIWIGTQAGLGRFDGSRFESFTSREGLSGNYITGLVLDRDGSIWVATQQGLSRIHAGHIEQWPLAATLVRAIAYSSLDRTLWILAAEGVFSIRGNRTTRFDRFPDPGLLNGLAATTAGMAFFSADAVFLLRNGTLQRFPSPGAVNFVKDDGGHIFVGCRDGLYVLNPFGEFRKYAGLPAALEDVSDILVDGPLSLWIASRGGVFYRDLQAGENIVFTTASGLIYDRASKLLLDREGNIFIGTRLGLSQLSRHMFRMYGTEDGLPSTHVWDILEEEGSLLLACEEGLAELRDGRIRSFPINSRLKDRSIRTIVRMNGGRYLLGSAEGEIIEWDRGTRLRSLLSGVRIQYAIRDSGGTAWFATDRGLLEYKDGDFLWFSEGLHDPIIWDVAELEPGALLVGTRMGVQLFRDGRFTASRWESQVGRSIINDILVLSPSEVLVATENNGVFWFKDGSLTHLTREQGLMHNDIWSVLRDNLGRIWMNSTRALECFADGAPFRHFNSETGLFGDEGCIHSALRAKSGRLYFGIVPGLVEYHLPGSARPVSTPSLVVADPLVKGVARPLSLSSPLRHDENTIEFRFLCPTTSRESPMRYKTRLFPFDGDWSPPGHNTTVRYTNLPPGTYTFQVLASNGGGETSWFGKEKRVVFSIRKPFWRRWWFRALELLLGLGLLALVMNLRFRVLKLQKKKLEETVQARTNEIAEKNRELAVLSITDPLTGLKNRRFLDESIHEDMSIIRRSLHDARSGLKPFDEKTAALGVFMLDIDHFKRVNDLHGHEAGDEVLLVIARRLQAMMRQSDTVARWGGEEFLIITRQSSKADAFPLAERIRQSIEQEAFTLPSGQQVRKTASIGFCHYPFLSGGEERLSWHQAVAMADAALYLAKYNGRNLVVGIQPGPTPFNGDGQDLLANLEAAVRSGQLEIVCRKERVKIPER